MGPEPLELIVEGWTLRIDIKDPWTQVCLTDADNTSRYMRISPEQAQELRDYLQNNLPVAA